MVVFLAKFTPLISEFTSLFTCSFLHSLAIIHLHAFFLPAPLLLLLYLYYLTNVFSFLSWCNDWFLMPLPVFCESPVSPLAVTGRLHVHMEHWPAGAWRPFHVHAWAGWAPHPVVGGHLKIRISFKWTFRLLLNILEPNREREVFIFFGRFLTFSPLSAGIKILPTFENSSWDFFLYFYYKNYKQAHSQQRTNTH